MRPLWPCICLAFVLTGCGGGGGNSVAGSPEGKETASGPFVGRSLTPGKILTMSGSNAVVVGLFGANYTNVRFQQPPISSLPSSQALDSTAITMDIYGQAALYDCGRQELLQLTAAPLVYNNPTSPDLGPQYDRIIWSPYLSAIQQVYQMLPDGTGNFLLNAVSNVRRAIYSPDGNRIAMSLGDGTLSVMNSSGSGLVNLITEPLGINSLAWTPDGTKIIYATGTRIKLIPLGGGTPLQLADTGGSWFYSVAFRSPTTWSAISAGSTCYYGNLTSWTTSFAVPNQTYWHTYSPDYRQMAVYAADGVNIRPAGVFGAPGTLIASTASYPHWAPYVEKRTLVGGSGGYGTTCAGFFYSLFRKQLAAFVTVESPAAGTVTFEKGDNSNPGQDTILTTVLAPGGLTAVKFQNRLYGTRYTPVTTAVSAKGAVIVFDALDGAVNFVLPFDGTTAPKPGAGGKGDTEKVLRGNFLGVFDREGKNVAPSGAKALTISADGKSVRV